MATKRKPMLPPPEDNLTIMVNPSYEYPGVARQITADRLMEIVSMSENGDTRELFALYRDIISSDNHIQAEFGKRKSAILGDVLNLVPWDKKNPQDVAAKEKCMELLDDKPFGVMIDWLLNATLFPVSVCEKVYAATSIGFKLDRVIPVPYQLLDYANGTLRIFDVDEAGRPLSSSHDPDPERYVVHRSSLMPVPDQWGGPLRSLLVWWMLRTMSRQWWANFLERFGMPFPVGKYKAGDDQGRGVLVQAFSQMVRLGALVVSDKTSVEIQQAATGDSSQSHERFIELCNREESKLILGQTLSAAASPTGELGGGTAGLQASVRDDLRKMDGRQLAVTIREFVFEQYLAVNAVAGRPPLMLFGSDSAAELKALMDLIRSLSDSGFEPDDDGVAALSERFGFGIRRKAVSAFPTLSADLARFVALSADPANVDLAAVFSGRYKAVADIVRNSESAEDCLRQVKDWATKSNLELPSRMIESVLAVFAHKGVLSIK